MKTYKVYLMPDAIKDLEQIYEYISEQSGFPERAWAYIEKLRLKCQKLETAPLRGQQRNGRTLVTSMPPETNGRDIHLFC